MSPTFARSLSTKTARAAPAQGFQSQGTGTGEEVDHRSIHHQLAQDVEQRLADQVAGRPGVGRCPRAIDLVATPLPRDDPHG